MKIKKNDTIKVMIGKDKGKTGKVLRVFPEENFIVVEGLNLLAKHVRPRNAGEKGQKVYFPARMNVSKVRLMCPKCSKPTRVGYRLLETVKGEEKKERVCKKCNQSLTVE